MDNQEITTLNEKKKEKNLGKAGMILAIVFSVLTVFLCVTNGIVILILFFPLLAIPFLLFVLSITFGIVGLADKKKTKKDKVYSIIGIALPIFVIVLLIILYSTNILVIRFM